MSQFPPRPDRRLFLSTAALAFGEAAWGNSSSDAASPDANGGAYRGNQHRPTRDLLDWHSRLPPEPAREPELPIVDAHHHLFGTAADRLYYRREDLQQDLASGHRVLGTVYVAAYGAGWRTSGPPALRSVGEVERIVQLSAAPLSTPHGTCQLAAGIVSDVDLSLGDGVGELLEAHVAAGSERLRGVRYYATYHDGSLAKFIPNAPRNIMADSSFRRGFAMLERFGLSFDALVYHTQLSELAALADAFPHTPIVLNHAGIPVGVLDFEPKQTAVRKDWVKDLRALAQRPNVRIKVGGMGMPIFGFGFEAGEKPAETQALVRAWQPLMEICIEAFGPQRCMLESNFPVDKQSCSYVQLWNAFKLATGAFSPQERQALFYRTTCRTYGLPELESTCDAAVTRQHRS
ncbi:Predicted metal-dependent hydrolase, TIM-barrel fold [Variovorax sp. YR266]|uniref:amidohydrolase family protein n=1 Tax=Variovorax sp. YR266 TaxID=1884386 RepID=UPI00089947C8|nr:amidohydrolase family protein [Variovorax sp. YR266]SDZ70786.1 Predicted metal-dependent hydrolase, TIM-barrel fold [Variovorax sp. YR266]